MPCSVVHASSPGVACDPAGLAGASGKPCRLRPDAAPDVSSGAVCGRRGEEAGTAGKCGRAVPGRGVCSRGVDSRACTYTRARGKRWEPHERPGGCGLGGKAALLR
eukprot:scaffold77861_cov64-Phaeocystis_antarctica.AAC.2